mgnify:CR=1 FL=1
MYWDVFGWDKVKLGWIGLDLGWEGENGVLEVGCVWVFWVLGCDCLFGWGIGLVSIL